mgnify:CR=1 FL=1
MDHSSFSPKVIILERGTWTKLDFILLHLKKKYKQMASLINSMTIIGKDCEETWIGSKNLVWAAALVHGGSKQNNRELTRLSHVTHYFFKGAKGAKVYWHPRKRNPSMNQYLYHGNMIPCTWNDRIPSDVFSCSANGFKCLQKD